jgi:hypothetical protein
LSKIPNKYKWIIGIAIAVIVIWQVWHVLGHYKEGTVDSLAEIPCFGSVLEDLKSEGPVYYRCGVVMGRRQNCLISGRLVSEENLWSFADRHGLEILDFGEQYNSKEYYIRQWQEMGADMDRVFTGFSDDDFALIGTEPLDTFWMGYQPETKYFTMKVSGPTVQNK